MIWLVIGVALWWAAHMFEQVAPGARAAMQDRMGDRSKGVIALVLVLSVVLMIIGFRLADYVPVYDPPAWGRHVNNLLMVIAVVLFGLGHSKSRLRSRMRNPMLWGTVTWAVAHLLANGDLAALILFGGIGVWALVEMPLIARQVPQWVPYQGGSLAGDIRLAVISLVLFVVIVLIHGWVGPWPLG